MAYIDQWCTEDDHRRIETATSFASLVEIAKQVITHNRKPHQPVIQVCGPMTTGGGTFESNTTKIVEAIKGMREEGLTVFSQVTFQKGMLNFTTIEDYRKNPLDLLDNFYGELFRGGYIQKLVFLHGWRYSLGCRWEERNGRKLGMEIAFLPDISTRPRILFALPQLLF